MISVRRVTSAEDFAALGRDWNNLLQRSTQSNPFLSHEWLCNWWLAFGNGARLHILLCMDGEELVGIFPGYVREAGWLPPTRRLRLLGSEVVGSDFLDVIAAPGRERAVLLAMLSQLREERGAHLLELTDLPEDSPLLQLAKMAEKDSGWRVRPWPTHKICPVIDLPGCWDDYLRGLSRGVRKNFPYYRRRLEALGARLEIVRDPLRLPPALDDFIRLHNCRRRQKQQRGIFFSAQAQMFYRRVIAAFAAAGWLELAFLAVEGERIAGVCQFDYGRSVYYYQTGYDVAWEKYSAGFVLSLLLIQRAIEAGKSSFEFLRGEEDYKYRLGANRDRCLRDAYLERGSTRAGLFLARKSFVAGCRGVARSFLRRPQAQPLAQTSGGANDG